MKDFKPEKLLVIENFFVVNVKNILVKIVNFFIGVSLKVYIKIHLKESIKAKKMLI